MITIVKFRAFDKDLEKVFYRFETPAQIHEVLKDICYTYIPLQIIRAALVADTTVENNQNALNELVKLQAA